MTEIDELKPCPFCGGEAAILDADYVAVGWNEGYRRAYVVCNSCGASGRKIRVTNYYGEPEGTVKDAIDAWNKRVYDRDPVADELSKCAIMNRLRQELDRRGCKWRDDSSVMGGPSFHYRHVMLRTKWEHDGEEVSVIWGYFDLDDGERTWMTYGAPDRLECRYVPNDPDPIPMTLDEILKVCA